MKKKIVFFALTIGAIASGVLVFTSMDEVLEKPRSPASTVPGNYDALKGCEKQEILWSKAQETVYKELPDYAKFGVIELLKMSRQELEIKGDYLTDFAPKGWKKYLHRRGALAKIKITPKNTKYSGIFQGADCALLRLSLTYKTAGARPVAPGLALKVLRDGIYSANISALVSLSGQEKDFNFFKNPMSNIVPVGEDFGQKMVHKVFKSVSDFPEELLVNDMADIDSHGAKAQTTVSPRQLFFVPEGLTFASAEHEIREDFLGIPEGTIVYKIYALSEKHAGFDYSAYTNEKAVEFLKESEHIADITTTSEFIASDFGDEGIFFRHQLRK